MRLALYIGLVALLLAPCAHASSSVLYGVNDDNFRRAWPQMSAEAAPLNLDQIAVTINCGEDLRVPAPVLVVWQCGAWNVRAFVLAHPNVREIQVGNEVNGWGGFYDSGHGREFQLGRIHSYLDWLASVHDALRGTGVKTLGFGAGPWGHEREIALSVRRWYMLRNWKHPVMDGFAYHPYWALKGSSRRYAQVMNRLWSGLPQPSPSRGLRFWWTETGMWSSGSQWLKMVGSPEEQAARVAYIARAAKADPLVVADFNFLLGDEPDSSKTWAWKSGLYFGDGTAKPAFYAFRDAIS